HWQALAEVAERTGATCCAGEFDAAGIDVPTDIRVADADSIPVGDCRLRAIHLVGHTPGSIALLYDDPEGHPHLFTGDCLFPGGVGNTQGDAERFATLLTGVQERLFNPLSDDTWVYPGHGRTPPWAANARSWTSGGSAAGSRCLPMMGRGFPRVRFTPRSAWTTITSYVFACPMGRNGSR
ncbi:MAG: hypothetical protein ACKOE2_14155, partial [Actinomycetales bacterium]